MNPEFGIIETKLFHILVMDAARWIIIL